MRKTSIENSSSSSDPWFSSNNHNSSSSSSSSSQHGGAPPPPPPATASNHPEENVPLYKKPRGRPPGSKNKPKSTCFVMAPQQHGDPSTRIMQVNVTPGSDVIESIIDVARRGHVSLTILKASGTVINVTLNTSPDNTAFRFHGPFTLVSLTGSYIYKNSSTTVLPAATSPHSPPFEINLCTSQGQVFGGPVAGTVVAGENVTLMVSTFIDPDI